MNQAQLKGLFSYDCDTGLFTRKVTMCSTARKGTVPKSINKDGYYQVRIDRKMYVQHRLAWLYVYGKFPDGDIDHVNHTRTDNRIENLRSVSKATNNRNIAKRNNNTSGVNGVWWHKQSKKWCAELKINGVKKYLGLFVNIDDAKKARLDANEKYDFHKNHGE